MLRRFLSIVLLGAMTLHCVGRLGGISFLYQNRHSLAYSMGLIAEIPIAVCSSDYDFNKTLKIVASETLDRMPSFVQAHDINFFFVPAYQLREPQMIQLSKDSKAGNSVAIYSIVLSSLFHPPTLLG
jgi:hypothetical protein